MVEKAGLFPSDGTAVAPSARGWSRRAALLAVAACGFAVAAGPAQAEPVQTLVLRALEIDPSLAEADANIAAAAARTESSRRQHWPRLGVAASEPITDRQRDVFDESGLRPFATLNVWSGGGIEAQVESGKDAEQYFRSKSAETREDIAYRVAALYLDGLRAEEELGLAKTNLARHDSLMRDLGVVAKLDTGRRSDLTQAQSRQGQARARLVTAETAIGVVQARLRRYSAGSSVQFEPVAIGAPELTATLAQGVTQQPEFLAQQAEVARLAAQVDVARARRWPTLDVETSYYEDEGATRLLLNWDLVNPSTLSNVDAAKLELRAAQARLNTVEFDLRERLDTARVSYEQAGRKQQVTEDQIGSAQQVVGAFEEQFQIARRSMLDLLNAYSELANVEITAASARHEQRQLALQYLRSAALTEVWMRQSRKEVAARQ